MLHRHDRFTAAILVAGDLILSFGALLLSYNLRYVWKLWGETLGLPENIPSFYAYLPFAIVIVITTLSVFAILGLYSRGRFQGRLAEFFALIRSVSLILIIAYGVTLFWRTPALSRWLMLFYWVIDIFFLTIFRGFLRGIVAKLRRRGFDRRKIIIIGSGSLAGRVAEKINEHQEYGYQLLGFVNTDVEETIDQRLSALKRLGNFDKLAALLEQLHPDEVFVAVPSKHDRLLELLDTCEAEGINATIVPDIFDVLVGRSIRRAQIEDMDGLPLIGVRQVPLHSLSNRFLKRLFDLSFATVFLLLFSWIYALTFLLVRLTSKGPALFKQERMGLDNRSFVCYKFRTMYQQSSKDSDTIWTEKDDPRITPLGRFLRRASIDELPQFFNVLKGEMSVVGPRPERPHFVKQFKEQIPRYLVRHQVKSGITGWAQINGRADISIDKKVDHDIYYIENWSFSLDLRIIALTVLHVLRGSNAY